MGARRRRGMGQDVPLGRRWKSNFVRTPLMVATMVWPALLPPAQRAQTSAVAARISTSLPLPAQINDQSPFLVKEAGIGRVDSPSSPHWDPSTTRTPSRTGSEF